MKDQFRKLYGDELADQVEQLKRKRGGVEVLKPRPKPEPKQLPERTEQGDEWWNK